MQERTTENFRNGRRREMRGRTEREREREREREKGGRREGEGGGGRERERERERTDRKTDIAHTELLTQSEGVTD